MTSKEILLRTASYIGKHGLIFECAHKDGVYCVGAALMENSYGYDQKRSRVRFWEEEYIMARNMLCAVLGISSSYSALVDYNDQSRIDKKTLEKTFVRTKEEVIEAFVKAANLPEVMTEKKSQKKIDKRH